MKRAAIYGRVSTKAQDTENQLRELRKVAKRHGWKVSHKYIDHGISGAKGRDHRPEYDQMLNDAVRKEFDVIMAWTVSEDRYSTCWKSLMKSTLKVFTCIYTNRESIPRHLPVRRCFR